MAPSLRASLASVASLASSASVVAWPGKPRKQGSQAAAEGLGKYFKGLLKALKKPAEAFQRCEDALKAT